MNVGILSRIQFAMTISFHFVFPPMTIGLGLILVIMQTLRLRTGRTLYLDMARFWTKVFGLIFAIGVATGIPMEFQFGTNWARYARFVGDIFGSPLAIEGIYAFFMESGFLALLLFGWNKVGPRMHLFATCMVALGAHFSAIWILVANSWMQTPAGYVVRSEDAGQVRAVVDDIRAAILNPSARDRLFHTIFACWIIGAFLVAGISAWWLLRGRHVESARASLGIGIAVATIACLFQMVAADSTARGVARNQPAKLAAIEGLAESQKNAPLSVAGWVGWRRDAGGRIVGVENRAFRLPDLLSILVSGDFLHPGRASETEVKGLAELPSDALLRARHPGVGDAELAALRPDYWPNVPVVFQTYHLMIAIGVGLTGIALISCLLWKSGKIWDTGSKGIRAFLGLLVLSPLLAQIATQAGWFTAEMGRQPWIVYEVLKTDEAASAAVRAPQVVFSMVLFFIIYLLLTVLFVSLLARKIRHGPASAGAGEPTSETWQPLSLRAERPMKD